MNVTLAGQPAYTIAYCALRVGESIFADRGAMLAMSDGIRVSGSLPGGIGKSILRKELGGESFFFTEFTAEQDGAWVGLSPKFPGDMRLLHLEETGDMVILVGAVVARDHSVKLDTQAGNLGSVLMHEGLFLLSATGVGGVLLGAYGAIIEVPLQEGQEIIVDTAHLIAWNKGMDFKVGPLGSVVTSLVSGEGLVAQLTGPGHVFIQTRAEQGLRDWILHPGGGQNKGHHGE